MRMIASLLVTLILGFIGGTEVQAAGESGGFVHTVTALNLSTSKSSVISHPLTNNNPTALLYVVQNRTPHGKTSATSNTSVGVHYDGNLQRWILLSLGANPLVEGSTFNIRVKASDTNYFVHTVSALNAGSTVLDYPDLNSNPEVVIVATHRTGTDNGALVINNHPFAVFYNETSMKWMIENQDGAPIPVGARFNLYVSQIDSERNFSVIGFDNTLTNGNKSVIIGSPLLDAKPNTLFWVTSENSIVADDGGMTAPYYLEYNNALGKWQVTTTGTSLVGVIFHVNVPGISISSNVLFNPSFEEAADGDIKLATHWKAKNLVKDKRKCNKPTKQKYVSNSGDCAFQFKGIAGVSSSIQQKVPLVPGQVRNIILSAAVSGKNLTSGVSIVATMKNPTGDKAKIMIEAGDIHAGTYAYKDVSKAFVFAPDFNTAKVKVAMKSGAGKLMIDDVHLFVYPVAASTIALPSPTE